MDWSIYDLDPPLLLRAGQRVQITVTSLSPIPGRMWIELWGRPVVRRRLARKRRSALPPRGSGRRV